VENGRSSQTGVPLQKLLLISILVATVLFPVMAARNARPIVGLRRALAGFALFEAFYLLAVLYLYPRL
jgi:hypothetical protein